MSGSAAGHRDRRWGTPPDQRRDVPYQGIRELACVSSLLRIVERSGVAARKNRLM